MNSFFVFALFLIMTAGGCAKPEVQNLRTATAQEDSTANTDSALVAKDVAVGINENTTVTGILSGAISGGKSLKYKIITNGTLGIAEILDSAVGTFKYKTNTDATGNDYFCFQVSDGTGDSNIAALSINIRQPDQPTPSPVDGVFHVPVATDGSVMLNGGRNTKGTLSASDPDGNTLTYSIDANGNKGSAVITNASTGNFTYTSNAGSSGTDSFTFKVNNGVLDSQDATESVSL